MKNKIFGGLVLIALASAGMHADAVNDGTAVIDQSRAEARMASPSATESVQSIVYGIVHDNVYPNIARVGQTISFWIDDNWNSSDTVDMFVSSLKDEDEPLEDTSRYTIVSQTENSAEIIFNNQGIYYVNYRVYDGAGQLVASYKSYQVLIQ